MDEHTMDYEGAHAQHPHRHRRAKKRFYKAARVYMNTVNNPSHFVSCSAAYNEMTQAYRELLATEE